MDQMPMFEQMPKASKSFCAPPRPKTKKFFKRIRNKAIRKYCKNPNNPNPVCSAYAGWWD